MSIVISRTFAVQSASTRVKWPAELFEASKQILNLASAEDLSGFYIAVSIEGVLWVGVKPEVQGVATALATMCLGDASIPHNDQIEPFVTMTNTSIKRREDTVAMPMGFVVAFGDQAKAQSQADAQRQRREEAIGGRRFGAPAPAPAPAPASAPAPAGAPAPAPASGASTTSPI
jgi:hypothetical protein